MKNTYLCLLILLTIVGCPEPEPTEPSVLNACLGAENIINAENFQFAQDLTNCSYDAMGDAEQTKSCMAEKYPVLSGQCLSCYGALARCGKQNCTGKCMINIHSPGCINCGTQNCRCEINNEGEINSFSLVLCTGIPIGQQPIRTSAKATNLQLTCPLAR